MNFAIIGCGRIAPRHAQALQEIPDVNLVVVADIKEERAVKFSTQYHTEYSVNYLDILDREDVDIVNICTPSGLHAEMAINAMQSGKDVIVEKPMALSLADADRMLAVSKSTKRKLAIVLQNRYNKPMRDLYQLVCSGKLGRILLGNTTVRWYRPQEYYQDEWHGRLAMDGGALMNQSIHHIDALQWCMGKVASVFAKTGTLAHKMEAEDTGVAVLSFENGALGIIEGSTITYPENLEGSIALFGEHGSVKVGGTALNQKTFWKVDGELQHERELLTRETLDPAAVYGTSHKHVFEDMIESVKLNREPRTNGYEARRSVALVLAMYESARLGQVIDMTLGNWYIDDFERSSIQ
jgi:predicted dehydrogenase